MRCASLDSLLAGASVALSCALTSCSTGTDAQPSITPSEPTTMGGAAGVSPTGGVSTIAGSATVVPNGAGGSLTPEGGTTSAGATSAGATASGAGGIEGVAGGAGSGSAGMAADGTCGQGAILCEDFEQYVDGSTPGGNWTATQRGNGKIVVDATRASSGKQSLHVTGRMNADRANISLPIHTDSQTAYVRFMLYTASYPASAGVHTRLMRIGTTQAASGTADTAYSLSSYNGTAIEKVNSIYLRDTGTKLNDPSTLNRWRCWEFSIDKSGGIGKVKVELLVDGRALPLKEAGSSSHGMTSPSWDPIPFEQFMLGLDGFQADEQPADFWIDDLSVTPQHEGCQATL